jgi:hypothetical protein
MVLFAGIESDVYYALLRERLNSAKSDQQLFEVIVNAPFSDRRRSTLLGLGIIVLFMVDKKTKTITQVAISDTDFAKGAARMSVKPFKDIEIPYTYKGNFIAEAVRSERYQQTSDWGHLFAPSFTSEESRLNQAGAGIACSFVYPLIYARAGGALVFNYYSPIDKIEREHHDFMRTYSRLATASLKSVK